MFISTIASSLNQKNDWYTKLVKEIKNNPRKLWSSINCILHRRESSTLPDCSDNFKLSNSFGKFFSEKNSKIRTILNSKDCTGEHIAPNYTPPNLTTFHPITLDETLKLISSSPNKSCDLDPCPTFIVKECKDILAPIIMGKSSTYPFQRGLFLVASNRPLLPHC